MHRNHGWSFSTSRFLRNIIMSNEYSQLFMCDLLSFALSITFPNSALLLLYRCVCAFFSSFVRVAVQRNVKRAYFPSARNAEPVPFNNNGFKFYNGDSLNQFISTYYNRTGQTLMHWISISIEKWMANTARGTWHGFMLGFGLFVFHSKQSHQFSGWQEFLNEANSEVFPKDFPEIVSL